MSDMSDSWTPIHKNNKGYSSGIVGVSIMFQKEDSALFGFIKPQTNDTDASNNNSKKGGKNAADASKKKKTATMDVPLKKSVRKQLHQRACDYFAPSMEGNTALQELLKDVFLNGNLSSRSLPLEQKQRSMVVYVKTGGSTDQSEESSARYPYKNSTQFVWMAMVDGKTKVVDESPTVALWAVLASCLTPNDFQWYTVQVPSAVSKYVCRGADLMKAGMRSIPTARPPTEEMDSQTVAIVVQGNPQPFAVGRLLIAKAPLVPSDPSMEETDAPGTSEPQFGYQTKGVGVEIWNTYGDDLWRQSAAPSNLHTKGDNIITNPLGGGDPFENGHYGNVGFAEGKFVYPLHGEVSDDDDDDDDAVENEETAGQTGASEEEEKASGEDGVADNISPANENGEEALEATETAEEAAAEGGSDQVEPTSSDGQETSLETHLHRAVCQALVNLSNKDFPMLVTTFYSKHVVPNSTQKIDLKETKYKKFGTYIKEQVAAGLLLVGPDKTNKKNKDPIATIIGYYKQHEDVQGLTKEAPTVPSDAPTKLVLVSLYMIQNSIVDLMRLDPDEVAATNATSEERRGTGMLTAPEVKKIVENYMEREELVHPVRKDQIQLDGPLTDAIFPPKQQKQHPQPLPTTMKRKDVVEQFTAQLQPAYALVVMPGSKITTLKKGNPPKVEIEVSMRQSKKFVTRIRGMEEYGIDGRVLSKDVSKRLACSSTVDTEAAAGRPALKKGRVEVEFQGNIVDELEALLTGDETLSSHGGVKNSDYAIPLKVLDVVLRKGVPARKRKGGGGGGKKKT